MKRSIFASAMFLTMFASIVFASGPGGRFPFQHPSLFPAAQTIAASGTVDADACGGLKRITATADRTTSTSYTIDTLNSPRAGCVMDIVNTSTNTITLDDNSSFVTPNNANIALGTKHSLRVASIGSYWVVIATANSSAH